jgi:peptide/nickel transport system permease protein/peptide/nickel transport system substrate-binding protein
VDDIAARKPPLAKAQRLERDAALCAPLAFEPEVVLHVPKVKGYVSNLIGKPRFDDVWLDV